MPTEARSITQHPCPTTFRVAEPETSRSISRTWVREGSLQSIQQLVESLGKSVVVLVARAHQLQADSRRVGVVVHRRATRVTADIGMQLNEMTIAEGAEHMRSGSPWLDDDVARVDAEIYLRRPPGYGLGYTIGNLQIQQLLGELRIQDGDAFDLKAFHDDFMAMGRMPVSLIRYEMLGRDDQVARFWDFEPIPPAG